MSGRGPTVALAATLHDAEGALARDIGRFLPAIERIYDRVCVATSPPTAVAINRRLERADVFAGTPSRNERGPLYRLSVRAAWEAGTDYVHYIDFDRALHWAEENATELRRARNMAAKRPVALFGRTPAAHASHQRALVETETPVNAKIAAGLGWKGRVDFLAPSFSLRNDLAVDFLNRSRARQNAIYGEMAALLATMGRSVAYAEWDGLSWETPKRDRGGVRRVGIERWRERFDTQAEWSLRRALGREVVRGFIRTRAKTEEAPGRLIRPT